jgi:hypothetical protein
MLSRTPPLPTVRTILALLCAGSLLGAGCRDASPDPAEVGSIEGARTAVSSPEASQSPETLQVRWAESFSAAQREARESGKPIFVAFNTMELGNPHSPFL